MISPIELRILDELSHLIKQGKLIMTAIDDLNAAISAISTSISAEITALKDAQASNNSAAIETAVANLNTLNSSLQASVATTAPVTVAAAS